MTNEIPRWRCHKQVRAFQIQAIDLNLSGYAIHGPDGIQCQVTYNQLKRMRESTGPMALNRDLVGGYLVIYEDNHISWSPAKAFEAGYTRDTNPTETCDKATAI